jgi:hypothetical protein
MAKVKWFRLTEDISAQFEVAGRVIETTLRRNTEIETGIHPKQVLLENGDVMWGLTRIPKEILAKPRPFRS